MIASAKGAAFRAAGGGAAALALAFALAGLQGCDAAAAAGDGEAFYRGKTVTVVVGTSPGGGYDLYARMLARYLGPHLPGNPTVIVQNLPGAGGIVAANHLYNVAPRDGTAFGILQNSLLIEQLIGTPEVRYDANRFGWIGSMNQDVHICVARADAPVRRFEELYTTSLRVGATGPGGETSTHPRFLNAVLGARFEVIAGYPGGNEVYLAIERGEVDGRCGLPWSSALTVKPEWFDRQRPFVRILIQMGQRKHPDLPDVPLVVEYARDARTRQVLETFFAPLGMARPFTAPPDLPPERLAALRRAFVETLDDPAFRAEAQRIRLELNNPLDGEETQALVRQILAAPPDQAAVIARVLKAGR